MWIELLHLPGQPPNLNRIERLGRCLRKGVVGL